MAPVTDTPKMTTRWYLFSMQKRFLAHYSHRIHGDIVETLYLCVPWIQLNCLMYATPTFPVNYRLQNRNKWKTYFCKLLLGNLTNLHQTLHVCGLCICGPSWLKIIKRILIVHKKRIIQNSKFLYIWLKTNLHIFTKYLLSVKFGANRPIGGALVAVSCEWKVNGKLMKSSSKLIKFLPLIVLHTLSYRHHSAF